MNYIVTSILNFMVRQNVITDKQEVMDFYRYGIEISISSILNVVLILLLGLISHHFVESILFLIVFIFMRSFMGGYYAQSYFRCNLIMCSGFVSVIVLFDIFKETVNSMFSVIISAILLPFVFFLCPVENKNKPIKKERKVYLRAISTMLYIVFSAAATIIIANGQALGVMLLFTMILTVLLVITAKSKDKIIKKGEIYEIIEEKDC